MTNRSHVPASFALLVVSVGALWSQSYSPLYAPQSSNQGTWACLDQYNNPIPGAYFTFSNGVYFYSNAHYHGPESAEPVSTTTPLSGYADSFGYITETLSTPLVGQEEYQSASCYFNGSYVTGTFDFAVGYGDVYYADVPSVWVKIGGSDTGGGTNHGTTAYNRYLTTASGTNLYNATLEYLGTHPGTSRVCTNDMALYIGGKFDICNTAGLCRDSNNNPIIAPWTSPHHQHDRGTAADVAGTGSSQCTTAGGSGVDVAQFITACTDNGAYAAYSFNEGNHAHCGFSQATWPH